ncbi:MAG: hypothetical protein BXU00_01320 [Candidatus Nanoclepta minutus]|uniref:Uncharacterized protein n=1 Tax=Candidatus Nanoclepta minutus TaxID=1940235 RepID=A0A397WMW2_9ARCH|nr:MAG: hypothetical protein BXU00_01320 [Candidatus Nanoclepta minutus]
MIGSIRVLTDIKIVEEVLINKEGFRKTRWQFRKKGQVFGLIKPINNFLEIHVRGYKDNTLNAELEISRKYLQHLFKSSIPFDIVLIHIFGKNNIPFEIIKPIHLSLPNINIPKFLISWKKAAIFIIAFIFLLIFLF